VAGFILKYSVITLMATEATGSDRGDSSQKFMIAVRMAFHLILITAV
jgi:hypothetical protein